MEALLGFFSDLILFSAGLVVAAMWIFMFIFMADEIIDLFLMWRNRNKKEEE